MMRVFCMLMSFLISPLVIADDAIHFKQTFVRHSHWLTYGIVMIALLLVIAYITQKYKPNKLDKALCRVVEKNYLGNKTVIYVIDYQEQRFLLADNQHSLSFCAVSPESLHAK